MPITFHQEIILLLDFRRAEAGVEKESGG